MTQIFSALVMTAIEFWRQTLILFAIFTVGMWVLSLLAAVFFLVINSEMLHEWDVNNEK